MRRLLKSGVLVMFCLVCLAGIALAAPVSPPDGTESAGGESDLSALPPVSAGEHPGVTRQDAHRHSGRDGSQVRVAQANGIFVSQTYNTVFGVADPNVRVLLRLAAAGGAEKGFNILQSDSKGNFGAALYPNGIQRELEESADIEATDLITVEAGARLHQMTVPAMAATVDIATRRVHGTVLPYAPVYLSVKGQTLTLAANFAGAFSASFISIMDLMPADDVRMRIPVANLWADKWVFAPGVLVRERLNEVTGFVEPGTVVTATLYSGEGELKGIGSHVANSDDGRYLIAFGADLGIDIVAGDRVEVVTSAGDGGLDTVTVMPIEVTVDAVADAVSGMVPANQTLRVLVRHQGDEGIVWHARRVVADGQGAFLLLLAGTVDITSEDEVWVTGLQAGNATEVYARAQRILVDQYYDSVEGLIAPDQEVAVSLVAADETILETTLTRSSDDRGVFEVDFGSDVRAGHRVIVAGDSISATIPVVDISVRVDIDADRLLVRAPPATYLFGVHYTLGAGSATVQLTTDATGQADVDLSDYDLRDGDSGRLYHINSEGHVNLFRYIQPSLAISLGPDRVMTWVDRNSPINLTLFDGAGAIKETVSLVVSDRGWAEWWPSAGLYAGGRVEVTCCGGRRAEVVLVHLTVGGDPATNQVYGQGPADELIESQVLVRDPVTGEEEVFSKTIGSDMDGNFQVDYNGFVDIVADDRVRGWWQTVDGDWLYADRFLAQMNINQTERAVYGQGMGYYANTTVALKDSKGAVKTVRTVAADKYGKIPWTVLPVQIRVNDRVTVADGVITVTIPVEGIYLQIAPEEDRIAGVGLPDSDLLCYVEHPTNSGQWVHVRSRTGPDGTFDMDLAGLVDLLPGDEVEVYHTNPSGHRIGVTRYALRLAIHQSRDTVRVWSSPDTPVTLTLRSADGALKETRTVTTDSATGRTPWGGEQFEQDISRGDVLESDNGALVLSTPMEPIYAVLDLQQNLVYGRVPLQSFMQLDFSPSGGASFTVYGWSDVDGAFAIGPGNAYHLAAGDSVDVWYTDGNGHMVGARTNTVVRWPLPLILRGGV